MTKAPGAIRVGGQPGRSFRVCVKLAVRVSQRASSLRVVSRLAAVLSTLAAAAVIASCGGDGDGASAVPSSDSSQVNKLFVRAVDRAAPHVVQIENERGLGSGVIFNREGDVVTNAHVVAGASAVRVTLPNGRRYRAEVRGTFAANDLAVVRVNGGGNFSPADFADSNKVKVGDLVLAVGNPLGLRSSVTNGIVSAVGRTVNEPGGAVLPNVIQTSAAINPGNSGGALVDLSGRVVGIPTLAAADPQLGGGTAPGIGFAISSNVVKDLAGQIVRRGKVIDSGRAYLGVRLTTGATGGAIVAAVAQGGPAAQAGIARGDAILAVAGQRTPTAAAVATELAKHRPDDRVQLEIQRLGAGRHTVEVKLGKLPA